MDIKPIKRGGRRPGAGRKKGVRDRATGEQRASLEELARAHTETALNTLVNVARSGESEAARVGAAVALLDRAYGRPRQSVEMTGADGGPIKTQDVNARDVIAERIASIAGRVGAPAGDSKPH